MQSRRTVPAPHEATGSDLDGRVPARLGPRVVCADSLGPAWLEGREGGQREAWRAEIIAQAAVSAGADDLDDTTAAIDREFLHVAGERTSPRYVRYFKKTRSDITRLGLESQLDVVREWSPSLKTETEAELKDLGARLEANVAAGDTAVKDRRASAAATADHRVREIVRFIDDVNAARRTRYGVLIQRGESLGLAKDWPLRFFRRGASTPKTKSE
ncbi:MAG: hypothetical protein U0414_37760 [Polyangiaceae bacterium]